MLTASIAFLALVIGSLGGMWVYATHLRTLYRESVETETVALASDVKKLRMELAAMNDRLQQVNDSTVLALDDLRGYVHQRYHRALAAEHRVKKKEEEEAEASRYEKELAAATRSQLQIEYDPADVLANGNRVLMRR